ncbi:DUF2463 domain-containing protein [Encephalitozoon hellem]|uniref:DUF2463 domain-containing protein n=1 Tax=Encephalitozoon hellem TaxID=27973 RepID=A0ABY8CP35_ENCHE|nr:DUF2463 domain-containing protein [Encephalitozoon hellem]WEL38541.1 DUF2463 domain-containing protein [Encephalitozoon hellem]WEL38742.1 DUF2463 domain-containing protein [Encephalitozoon hellem]WEL39383.1 DUF2463 domain-containing protein [Encephalitozoon hellem]
MNFTINVSQLYLKNNYTKEHRVKLDWRDAMRICVAPMSIVLPVIIYSLLEEHAIRHSILLKFIIVLPPFLYSGIQYFILFDKNRRTQCESPSIFNSAIGFLLSIALLLPFVTAFIFIIGLSITNWKKYDIHFFLTVTSPHLISFAYLLSTSCSLTRSNFQYTTTGAVDILLDLIIFILMLGTMADLSSRKENDLNDFCPVTIFAIVALIRSYRESYLLSAKHRGPTKIWRLAILTIPLLIVIATIYKPSVRLLLLDTFKEEFQALYSKI